MRKGSQVNGLAVLLFPVGGAYHFRYIAHGESCSVREEGISPGRLGDGKGGACGFSGASRAGM